MSAASNRKSKSPKSTPKLQDLTLPILIILSIIITLLTILFILYYKLNTPSNNLYDYLPQKPLNNIVNRLIRKSNNLSTTPESSLSVMPTATPIPLPTGSQSYLVQSNTTGPKVNKVIMEPLDAGRDSPQIIRLTADQTPVVTKINLLLITDNQKIELTPRQVKSDQSGSEWEISYRMPDTHDHTYQLQITAYDATGQKTQVTASFR